MFWRDKSQPLFNIYSTISERDLDNVSRQDVQAGIRVGPYRTVLDGHMAGTSPAMIFQSAFGSDVYCGAVIGPLNCATLIFGSMPVSA